ncbi:MAG: hypothetical protein ACJASD_003831 [Sphingomonas echinoides]|jgi:hypothetical protein
MAFPGPGRAEPRAGYGYFSVMNGNCPLPEL